MAAFVTVDECFLKHGTDKASNWHNYGRQYAGLFAPWRSKPIVYLEIGVREGASLRAMRDVFPAAKAIVGLDIDPDAAKYSEPEKGIFVHIGDGTNAEFLQSIVSTYGNPHIILDDGSHFCSHVIQTFSILFPHLVDGGLYIVEDTCVFENSYFADVPGINHLEFFAQYVAVLNVHGADFVADPFKIQRFEPDVICRSVDRIEFGCGYVALHKLERTHWTPPSSVVCG